MVSTGHLVTPRTHSRGSGVRALRGAASGFGARTLRGLGRSFSPAKPSMAGSRVSAMTTAMPTPTEAATPIVVRKGMPATASPLRAIITVRPANTTADPAVATASATDSSASIPAAS